LLGLVVLCVCMKVKKKREKMREIHTSLT